MEFASNTNTTIKINYNVQKTLASNLAQPTLTTKH
jgi:hypothetical protein